MKLGKPAHIQSKAAKKNKEEEEEEEKNKKKESSRWRTMAKSRGGSRVAGQLIPQRQRRAQGFGKVPTGAPPSFRDSTH